MIGLLIVLYLLIAVVVYSYSLGYQQRRYANVADEWFYRDVVFSIFVGLLFPLFMILIIHYNSFSYGRMFWRKK